MSELLDPYHCISNNLHQTARAVTRIYGEELRPSGLKRSQFSILGYLSRLDHLRLTELADLLFMERTTLTRNLKPLQNQGLIEMRSDPTDKRVKIVAITQEGRTRFSEALVLWRKAQQRMVEVFGLEQWRELEATLRHLRAIVPTSN